MTLFNKVTHLGLGKRLALVTFCSLGLAFSLVSQPAKAANKSAAVRNAEIYMQLEQLQQEVQQLRNLVEIQANQLKQNEASQRNRYLDLDQRAQEQTQRLNKLEEQQFNLSLQPQVVQQPASTSNTGASNANPVNAKSSYDQAYGLVVERDFNQAIIAFKNFINDYPTSNLIGNAYYWLGEIYLAQNNRQEAKKMFLAVTNNYPRSYKLADSKYKLALIESRFGNKDLAKQLMQQLIDQHPTEPAADLAKAYLKNNS